MSTDRTMPREGRWKQYATIGPEGDLKARVLVWTPGLLDRDFNERSVEVEMHFECLTPTDTQELAARLVEAADHARWIAAWAKPLWDAVADQRMARDVERARQSGFSYP